MNESGGQPVGVLVVVEGSSFSSALVQVLKNCAPFPLKAAVTNSLIHALEHLQEDDANVDVVLIDAEMANYASGVSIRKVREITSTPTVAFARGLTRDVDEQMRKYGADVVLSRDVLDPMTLIQELQRLMERHPAGKRNSPLQSGGPVASRDSLKTEAEENDVDTIAMQVWLDGACRLQEFLADQHQPSEAQTKRLRKLLGKPKRGDEPRIQ
jgi:DNA-binding NarL/FixJ family response regulator